MDSIYYRKWSLSWHRWHGVRTRQVQYISMCNIGRQLPVKGIVSCSYLMGLFILVPLIRYFYLWVIFFSTILVALISFCCYYVYYNQQFLIYSATQDKYAWIDYHTNGYSVGCSIFQWNCPQYPVPIVCVNLTHTSKGNCHLTQFGLKCPKEHNAVGCEFNPDLMHYFCFRSFCLGINTFQ